MLFSSITFLFLFLPIMLAVYYIAPPQWKNLLLLAGSLIFYAWGEPVYIILMILSILLNYFCGMDIENKSENEAKAKRSLVFAITVNIVLLVFFKYFGFLVESTNISRKGKSTAESGEVCAVCIHVSAAGCRTNRLLWRY